MNEKPGSAALPSQALLHPHGFDASGLSDLAEVMNIEPLSFYAVRGKRQRYGRLSKDISAISQATQRSVMTVPAMLSANPAPNSFAGVSNPGCRSPLDTRRAASTAASGV